MIKLIKVLTKTMVNDQTNKGIDLNDGKWSN